MNDFSILKNRYFIKGELVTETPLHVGGGESLEPAGTDLPVLKTFYGAPYIPGSSIKGVFRSNIERILKTLDAEKVTFNGNRIWACNFLVRGESCIEKNKSLCTACQLFGSSSSKSQPGISSKIFFMDSHLSDGKAPVITEIKDCVAIDRDTGTAKDKGKFDYEIVPPGVRFKLEIIMENVEEEEVALIGLVLKLLERGEISLGGKTSTGLGRCHLEKIVIEKIEANRLLEYILDNKREPVNLDEIMKKFQNMLRKGEANA
ncbi:MAG: CRISPR-associated RAMP protein Csx7 [Candidatus Odinarchaeum yellowstonii]|uniref:CRISPR-associated RAMP protein Csx7 n=1 Tax=Odinarchaeota yellowstonii (strain LCB_4) TaxID=1841599 RepID=A0AAF0IBU6_ODILC|nr:MAG: CRISPR-associated RAMP protein Csx7 [Candidatus Odinarchaeum yellowstonii]